MSIVQITIERPPSEVNGWLIFTVGADGKRWGDVYDTIQEGLRDHEARTTILPDDWPWDCDEDRAADACWRLQHPDD